MLICHQDQEVELLHEHAVFLPASSALVLADVHFGKAMTFQANGLPVPLGDDERDLARITDLLDRTRADHLVIAGDLLHAPAGATAELLETLGKWFERCGARTTLVIGNHDRRVMRGVESLPVEAVDSLELGGFMIHHDPEDLEATEKLSICGHLHPVVRLKDGRRPSIRTPCFYLSDSVLTLPAFGTFTGGNPIRPRKGDRIFIPLSRNVSEAPPGSWCW